MSALDDLVKNENWRTSAGGQIFIRDPQVFKAAAELAAKDAEIEAIEAKAERYRIAIATAVFDKDVISVFSVLRAALEQS